MWRRAMEGGRVAFSIWHRYYPATLHRTNVKGQRVTRSTLPLLLAILLLSLSLRPLMAALGPVLDLIAATTGMDSSGLGMLTTLPILIMGLGALGGGRLRRYLGERQGVAFGIACLAAASGMRLPFHGAPGMIVSAIIGGMGVAACQALLPGLIKRNFGAATGNVMGLYTTGIMTGSALGAAGSADLARLLGWQGALSLWAFPALIALIVWLAVAPRDAPPVATTTMHKSAPFAAIPRSWTLVVFFGLGTGAYTLAIAWLPPYYQSLGVSREVSGYVLAGLTVTEVFVGLAIAAWIGHFPDRRAVVLTVLGCLFLGFALLVAAPITLVVPTTILLGIGMGAVFPLGLIITMDHLSAPDTAGTLAGFVQGWGYILASTLPFAAGVIRDQFATLTQAWYLMMAGVAVMAVITIGFSRESYRRYEARVMTRG